MLSKAIVPGESSKKSERVFTKDVMSKFTIKLPSPYLPLHESQSETSSTAGNGGVGKRKDSQKNEPKQRDGSSWTPLDNRKLDAVFYSGDLDLGPRDSSQKSTSARQLEG